MREILGLIIFWISTIGYILMFKDKTKLPHELILPMTFTLIGIVMFISGILNMMIEFSIIICLVGIILTFYYVFKKKSISKLISNIKQKKVNVNVILILLAIIYISIIGSNMHLLHYDNFSHWGLIVKNMFLSDALPNFQNTALEFLDYQPGSACFIYYLGFLAGKNEGVMIIAQNYLIITYFLSLLVFINNNKSNIIARILVFSVLLLTMFINIRFNDLLVDTLLAVMSIYSVVLFYYFKDDLKSAFLYTLPVSVFLFLVKNTGIVMVGINCLILLILGFKNKNIKKGFIYAFISGIITLAFFYIWSRHVVYVYGDYALSAKHSMSAHNIVGSLREKGMDNIWNFCIIYLRHFIDIINNIPNKYIIGINLLYVALILLYKKQRKNIFKFLAFSDIIYLGYYTILGIMYLLSMPWEEAKILASFDRYMFTIICVIIGILLICVINIISSEKKAPLKLYAYIFVLIILSNFLTFKYYVTDIKLLWGDLDYKFSNAYKYDTILNNEMYSSNSNDFYYIYTPNTQNDSGYMYYLSRYKLNTYKFEIIYNINDINSILEQNKDKDYQEKVILFTEDKESLDYMKVNNYKEISNSIYIKN